MQPKSPISIQLRNLRVRSGLSVRDIAARAGMPTSTYQNYEGRFKGPYLPLTFAENLAVALSGTGVDRAEVLALAGVERPARVENGDSLGDGMKLVPVYDVAASAGFGVLPGYESIAFSLAFPPGYLQRLTQSNPKNLVIISVKGDSMLPTLSDDDVVMIDVSKRNVDFDGLFVFRFGEALHIKRVTRAPRRGFIVATSDNRALYDPIEYPVNEVDVIGRVIWFGKKV